MKLLNKKANAFVYAIILVNLALIIALVVYNNTFIIQNNFDISENNALLTTNLVEKAEINLSMVKQYNTNGSLFNDSIACPELITFFTINSSGQIVGHGMIGSTLQYENGYSSCDFFYNGREGKINILGADFLNVYYDSILNNLTQTGANLMTENPNSDGTYMLFRKPTEGDNIDDNFNSDNFRATSIDNYEYPDGFIDDDIFSRLTITNEIKSQEDGYYNIFWNNTRIRDYINDNPFNSDVTSLLVKMGDVAEGNLKLDISSSNSLDYDIKLIEFDKDVYEDNSELVLVNTHDGNNLNMNSGYLTLDSDGSLILNKVKTGDELSFDLQNKDYALFIKNNGDSDLIIQLSGEEKITNKKIFLNAINDSFGDKIETLVNYIILNNSSYINGHYTKSDTKDYFSNTYNCKKSGDIVEARTRYPGCDTNDIVVCSGAKQGYVVAACNVGAKYAGIGEISYGNYFQWGNNYGFPYIGSYETTMNTVDTTGYGYGDVNGYYTSPIFVVGTSGNGFDWSSTRNDNLWGNSSDVLSRRGPCPFDYHIPLHTEWQQVISMGNWGNDGKKMSTDLKLPYSSYKLQSTTIQNYIANRGFYRTSTSSISSSYYISITDSTIVSNSVSYRSTGLPIRCFKN